MMLWSGDWTGGVTSMADFVTTLYRNSAISELSFLKQDAGLPAKVDSQMVLAYELHITNFLPREISLNRIEVLGDGPIREPIISYQENDLIKHIR
jgi:hypothetical protein